MGDGDSLKIKHHRRELSLVSIPRLKSQEGGGATPQLMVENIFCSHGTAFVPWAFHGPTAETPCRGYRPCPAIWSDTPPSRVARDRFFCSHRMAILPVG